MNIHTQPSYTLIIGLSLIFFSSLSLSACSNTDNRVNRLQEVQMGTVVATKRIIIKPEPVKPHGNIGVSVGSGGHSGIYGAVDILTLGSLLGIKKKDKVMQEIIIKRPNGKFVAVTQPIASLFKKGDRVKIIQRGNKAQVIH